MYKYKKYKRQIQIFFLSFCLDFFALRFGIRNLFCLFFRRSVALYLFLKPAVHRPLINIYVDEGIFLHKYIIYSLLRLCCYLRGFIHRFVLDSVPILRCTVKDNHRIKVGANISGDSYVILGSKNQRYTTSRNQMSSVEYQCFEIFIKLIFSHFSDAVVHQNQHIEGVDVLSVGLIDILIIGIFSSDFRRKQFHLLSDPLEIEISVPVGTLIQENPPYLFAGCYK